MCLRERVHQRVTESNTTSLKVASQDVITSLSGIFGRSYSAADGLPSGSVWRETLANRGPVLEWLLMRMDSDYKGTHVRLRKCWKTADLALCLQVKVGATCQF